MPTALEYVRSRTALQPTVGVVLGSGLGAFAESLSQPERIPYHDIPGFPTATAIGHKGELLLGSVGGTPVAVMSGRFHLYEGYTAREAACGIRLLRQLGVRTVVLTNAAGGINLAFAEGALVLISDHINLQGANDDALGPRFPDMSAPYSALLRDRAYAAAKPLGITLHEGVYCGLLGPSYETPAEIRFLRTIGADLVGMSTVAETIAANHMGMAVLGISCVTNVAAGLSDRKLNHEEVLAIGQRVAGTFLRLLSALIPTLD